jgi:hypothetical protein
MFAALDGANEYDEKLRAHNEGREHDQTLREPTSTNWWDDPAAWRIRVYEVQEFTHIPLALRLVALVQPSCGIERVFPQLKLVLDEHMW